MGAYLCIASNDVPPAVSKRVILNVNFAPEITVPSQLYGVGPGSNVTISCNVQAYPTAINYWMKDDNEMLLSGPKYNITEKVRNRYEIMMYLTIINWQRSDESQFSCISTNSLGKADGRIQSYTFVSNTDPETRSTPNNDYSDNEYSYATNSNNANNRKQNRDSKRKRKKASNKGSNSRYHQDEKIQNRFQDSNRRQKSFNPDQKQETGSGNSESYGTSYFVNGGGVTSSNRSLEMILFVLILLFFYQT